MLPKNYRVLADKNEIDIGECIGSCKHKKSRRFFCKQVKT